MSTPSPSEALALEGLEWCRDFQEGMFTPAHTADGWSVEMHGLVASHERLCKAYLALSAYRRRVEGILPISLPPDREASTA